MISGRYAGAVAVLMALALVPTLLHGYIGVTRDDGRRVAAIPPMLAGMFSVRTDRDGDWGRRRFDAFDWTERTYTTASGQRLVLFVGRSYDAKKLYHHPEIDIARGRSYGGASIVRTAELPGVPVHVLRGEGDGSKDLALYVLHYDDRFVENPYLFQISVAVELLVRGRQAMTLFFVRADGGNVEPLDGSPPLTLLREAIASFLGRSPGAPMATQTR